MNCKYVCSVNYSIRPQQRSYGNGPSEFTNGPSGSQWFKCKICWKLGDVFAESVLNIAQQTDLFGKKWGLQTARREKLRLLQHSNIHQKFDQYSYYREGKRIEFPEWRFQIHLQLRPQRFWPLLLRKYYPVKIVSVSLTSKLYAFCPYCGFKILLDIAPH